MQQIKMHSLFGIIVKSLWMNGLRFAQSCAECVIIQITLVMLLPPCAIQQSRF